VERSDPPEEPAGKPQEGRETAAPSFCVARSDPPEEPAGKPQEGRETAAPSIFKFRKYKGARSPTQPYSVETEL